jgi:hypothetical protein
MLLVAACLAQFETPPGELPSRLFSVGSFSSGEEASGAQRLIKTKCRAAHYVAPSVKNITPPVMKRIVRPALIFYSLRK